MTTRSYWFCACMLLAAGASLAAEYYVAVDGHPAAPGTEQAPLDLQSAIHRGSPARPGDTIWMAGGEYVGRFVSYLTGAPGLPVTLRASANQRVTIDGGPSAGGYPLTIDGAWAVYRDFEVTDSATAAPGALQPVAVQCVAANVRLINLVVHDGGQGIGCWLGAVNAEVADCIIYNNGAGSLEHGLYLQNDVRTGIKRIHDNIVFNNSGFGVHAYTQGGQLTGFDFQGNVLFNNGAKSASRYDNLFVGGTPPNDQITVVSNFSYFSPGSARFNFRFSYQDHQHAPHGSLVLRGNYIAGGTGLTADDWRQIAMTGNVLIGFAQQAHVRPPPGAVASAYSWDFNRYHGASSFGIGNAAYDFAGWRSATGLDANSTHDAALPRTNAVFVRASRVTPGRATAIIYNWTDQPRVGVPVDGFLAPGTRYEARNAQDYFGPPVLAGVHLGGPLLMPMTNLTVAQPSSGAVVVPTGRQFNVFVIQGFAADSTPTNNTPPGISPVPNQVIDEDSPPLTLPFVVEDAESPAGDLTVSTWSSNAGLVSNENLMIAGQGAERVLRLTPAADQSGVAVVTLAAHDGQLTGTRSFHVVVRAVNDPPTVAPVAGQLVQVGESQIVVPVEISDPDNTQAELSINVGASDPAVLPPEAMALTGAGTQRLLILRPMQPRLGTVRVFIEARDPTGEGTRREFSVLFVPEVSADPAQIQLAASEADVMPPLRLSPAPIPYIEALTFGEGTARFSFSVSRSGKYIVWAEVLAPSSTGDSFFVAMDNGPEDIYDVAEGAWSPDWQWTAVNGRDGGNPLTLNPRVFPLGSGAHTLIFRAREVGARLRQVRITLESSGAPGSRPAQLESVRVGSLQRAMVFGHAGPGKRCLVQLSLDLRQWAGLGYATANAAGNFIFLDPVPADSAVRFYRAFLVE